MAGNSPVYLGQFLTVTHKHYFKCVTRYLHLTIPQIVLGQYIAKENKYGKMENGFFLNQKYSTKGPQMSHSSVSDLDKKLYFSKLDWYLRPTARKPIAYRMKCNNLLIQFLLYVCTQENY